MASGINMIQRTPELDAFELRWLRDYPNNFQKNLRRFEDFRRHACAMGAFPLRDPLDGIEDKIKFARAINGLKTPRGAR